MKYLCKKCGARIGVTQDKCYKCGAVIHGTECGKCGFFGAVSDFTGKDNNCPKCGEPVRISTFVKDSKYCSICGKYLDKDDSPYCKKCGKIDYSVMGIIGFVGAVSLFFFFGTGGFTGEGFVCALVSLIVGVVAIFFITGSVIPASKVRRQYNDLKAQEKAIEED